MVKLILHGHWGVIYSKCVVLLMIFAFLSGIVDSDKESILFTRKINKVALVDQNLIVTGEGFIATISTKEFKSSPNWLEEDSSKNYSILATQADSFAPQFVSCYANNTRAACIQCSKTGCQEMRSYPLYAMRSFVFLQTDSLIMLTPSANNENTFVSAWNSVTGTMLPPNIQLKRNWAYDFDNVARRDARCYAFSKVSEGSKNKTNVLFELEYIQSRYVLDFVQAFVNLNFGEPAGLISISSSETDTVKTLHFFTKQNRIGNVVFAEPNTVSRGGDRFDFTGRTSISIGNNPNEALSANEVSGIVDALWKNESISSGLLVKGLAPQTLLYLGTQQGRMLKFSFVSNARVTAKYRAVISKQPYAHVMLKAIQNEFLYGYVKKSDENDEVFRIGIHDCKDHSRCSSCLSPLADRYCSWFPLENRCRFDEEMDSNSEKDATSCPHIQSINPSAVPLENVTRVHITLVNIQMEPLKEKHLSCLWLFPDGQKRVESAQVTDKSIECLTPNINSNYSPREPIVIIDLQILMNGNISLVEKKLPVKFYDCRLFRSCTRCQSSHSLEGNEYKCGWQTAKKKCVLYRDGQETAKCPQLDHNSATGQDFKIPNKTPWNITLKGERLKELQNSDFKCYIGNRSFDLFILNNTRAYCSVRPAVDFEIDSGNFEKITKLRVSSQKEGIDIDSKDGKQIQGIIYQCSNLNCSACLIEGENGYLCRTKQNAANWRCETGRRSEPLPLPNCGQEPIVSKIYPPNGPLEGGTLVAVSGEWLGVKSGQLTGKVLLAGKRCINIKVKQRLKSFECTTAAATKESSGLVKIGKAISRDISFSYKNFSSPYNIRPNFCFTDFPAHFNVTIKNFNIGRKRSITVDGIDLTSQIANPLSQTDRYQIKCPSGVKSRSGKLVVTVDGSKKTSASMFEFLQAPYLRMDKGKTFESIESGGVMVVFSAPDADCLTSVKLSIVNGSVQTITNPSVICETTKDEVRCRSPPGKKSESSSIALETIPNVNFTRAKRLRINYFQNPQFNLLDNTTVIINDELILEAAKGSNLLQGATKIDYSVQLGAKNGTIIRVSENFLICNIGELTEEERKNRVTVKVFIGISLNYTLGTVQFEDKKESWKTILGIVAGVLIFSIVGIPTSFFLYKRRRDIQQEKDRQALGETMEIEYFAAANASRNGRVRRPPLDTTYQ